jgi:class 3 adenylate cyclase/tetratricopeptide (TPR) repeat protein
MNCSVCGQPLPEGAQFCPNCGASVHAPLATEERKMVTVLFADLVDSTGLAQRLDPERAREVLGRFFDAVTEELQTLRGRPEKFIGDAVMAVFGLPQVHEDDAVRAVRAGLAIRDRARRLSRSLGLVDPLDVHIGVETGEAATGVGPAGQLLVTGQVVNAAARLQSAAAPGEVLVGGTTYSLTESALSFGDPRTIDAKGFDEGLVGHPVEGLTTRSVRRTIPFVGRASELAILRDCVARVASAGKPLLFTVVGESGIGKSRLADELLAGIDESVTVVTGRGQSHTDTATFAAAAAIVRDIANIEDTDPAEKARRRLEETVDRWCLRDDAERTTRRLALLLGLTAYRRDESAFVADVQAGFLALLEGVARDAPVVLAFDDLQQLPAPMLDLVERLAARARHGPRHALILALARPSLLEERPRWGEGATNAMTMRLEPLPPDEALELVRQAGGDQIQEVEATAIAERAGGNPFFIVETTGMCLRLEEEHPAEQRPLLPPTVQAVVAARLDDLEPSLRDIVRRSSVFLVSFDEPELAVVGGAAVQDLHQLEEAEILVRDEFASTPRWRFRHATLREVAYGSLPKRERMRLHELVADSLLAAGHPSWAADHFELAAIASLDLDPEDRRLPERAADALLEAGDRARRRTESRPAVALYERMLALAGPEERWGVREARALAGIGEARYWLSEYPGASEALTRAVAIGTEHGDDFTLAIALRFLGDIALNVEEGKVDEAERLLDRSLEAAERLGEPFAIARSLLFAGWVPWNRDDTESAEKLWRRALAIAEESDDGWARIRALTALSINQGDLSGSEEAMRLIEEAIALAEARGDQFSIAMTAVQRSRVLEDLGRFEEALPGLDRAIAIFEDLGARWELADATAERGIIRRELGRLDAAEEDLKLAIRFSEELGELQLASWTWRALAKVAERRGDVVEAEERNRRANEARERRGL